MRVNSFKVALLLLLAMPVHAAYRSSNSIATTSGTSTSLTVTTPAGTAQDDIVILCAAVGGSDAATFTWPAGEGFTQFTADASTTTPDTKSIRCAWKREDSSPPANYNVANDIGGGDKMILIAASFSGRHTTNAPTAVASTQQSAEASPVTIDATGVTAAAGDDILWFASQSMAGSDIWTFSPPTNYTERQEAAANLYTAGAVATRDNVSAGATGTLDGTMTLAASSAGWGAIVIQIPAAAGGSPSGLLLRRRRGY